MKTNMRADRKKRNKHSSLISGLTIISLVAIFVILYSDFSYASWVDEEDGIKYIKEDGEYAIGFLEIDDNTYYFDTDGHLVTGKYYVEEAKAYYYFDASGALQYGAIQTDDDFYVADDTGKLQTGFVSFDDKLYYFNEIVQLVVGWFRYQDNWYYANYCGEIQTGFVEVDGYTYYLNEDGTRTKEDTLTIEGVTYFFNEDGSVDDNTTAIYPIFQAINTWRTEEGKKELTMDDKLQSVAIIRAAGLVESFTVDDNALEKMLDNMDVSCTGGIEFAYGGTQGYDYDALLNDIKRDNNMEQAISDDNISGVGIGVYEQESMLYFSLIFIK
ncbi:MAG: hypothetical protein E7264_02775 [Lachnospiraceae bacterium]|nr:hypothetical protein [Lachnospiraceae bacterium]